jgi:hypothetical protein
MSSDLEEMKGGAADLYSCVPVAVEEPFGFRRRPGSSPATSLIRCGILQLAVLMNHSLLEEPTQILELFDIGRQAYSKSQPKSWSSSI